MDRKQIQQTRIMSYFIDAACKVIEEDGYKGLTVRKVADLAGYHYSTIYNYFNDLNHLAAHATLKFFDTSAEYLKAYAKDYKGELENYKKTWEGFCRYCLEHPNAFRSMFIEDMGDGAKELIIQNLSNSRLFKSKQEGIISCIKKNLLPPGKIEEIEQMLLSACIGRVIMYVTGRSTDSKENVIKGFNENMNFILDNIKW